MFGLGSDGFCIISNSFHQPQQRYLRHFESLLFCLRHWLFHSVFCVAVKASIPWARLQALGSSGSMGSGRRDDPGRPGTRKSRFVPNEILKSFFSYFLISGHRYAQFSYHTFLESCRVAEERSLLPYLSRGVERQQYHISRWQASQIVNGRASTEFEIEGRQPLVSRCFKFAVTFGPWCQTEIALRNKQNPKRENWQWMTWDHRYRNEASQKIHQVPAWMSNAATVTWRLQADVSYVFICVKYGIIPV